MALSRIVYTHSGVTVDSVACATAQNATVTFNVPRENVNAFGLTGTVDRPQLDASDATFEFSMIPQDSGQSPTVSAAVIAGWVAQTLANAPSRIAACVADGVGQVDNALINSLSSEATIGAMANMTLSYTGAPNATVPAVATPSSASLIPLVTSKDVSLASGFDLACAQSATTAWDIPVETVICLGSDPAVASNVNTFGNPPGTASITIEGLDEGLAHTAASADYTLAIGAYSFELTGGRVDSQTNSLAVGDVFGTFNYVISGTGDGYNIS